MENKDAKRNIALMLSLVTVLLAVGWQLAGQTPRKIEAGRPLAEAALRLEAEYAVPVTYEDPLLLWRGDMVRANLHPDTPPTYAVAPRSIRFLDDVEAEQAPALNRGMIERVLNAYQQENPEGPRFRIETSEHAFHIVPDAIRDQSGQETWLRPLLDIVISVPEEKRMAAQHVDAICQALAAASGIRMGRSASNNAGAFLAATYAKRRGKMDTEADIKELSFVWGASGMTAREALLALFAKSDTTLTWKLRCGAQVTEGKGLCALEWEPLEIAVTGSDGKPERKLLLFDRCVKCPPLLALPSNSVVRPIGSK
jgi:hypothetical protein